MSPGPAEGHRQHRRTDIVLTVTENAQTLVRALTEQAQVGDSGGIRLAPGRDAEQLEVSLVAAPGERSSTPMAPACSCRRPLDGSTLSAEGGEQPACTLTR